MFSGFLFLVQLTCNEGIGNAHKILLHKKAPHGVHTRRTTRDDMWSQCDRLGSYPQIQLVSNLQY